MSIYKVTVRRTATVEFETLVEADSRAGAMGLAEDPGEWLSPPDYDRIIKETEEVEDIIAMDAVLVDETG